MNNITKQDRANIVSAIRQRMENWGGTNEQLATHLGINPSQLSQVLNERTEKVLSERNWMSIARMLEVNLSGRREWRTANTHVLQFITQQLEHCQKNSVSGLLVDAADVGKTHAAKHYTSTHKHAVYVDCSLNKTRTELIREIARGFGVNSGGTPSNVFKRLTDHVRTIPNALVVLDEFGDLRNEAFMEVKSLWNATEGVCGWYMMGADGLKRKFERGLDREQLGYAELFRRLGSRIQRATPEGGEAFKELKLKQAAMVLKANSDRADVGAVIRKTQGSLTRVRIELTKQP